MPDLLGVPIYVATLEAWAKIFVFEIEPFFLDQQTLGLLEDVPLIYSRSDFNVWLGSQPLEYKDAYRFWNVKLDAVVLLTSQEFGLLPQALQKKLNAVQVKANRGLVFPLADAERFGVGAEFLKRDSIKDHFVLRFDAWWSLTRVQRFSWLRAYVETDGLSMNFVYQHPLMRFFPNSGANCFATALAGIEKITARAVMIARLWLTETVFLSSLESRGFQNMVFNPVLFARYVILTWHDSNGKAVHASTCLGNDLWLNKDSQAWYSPVQVLTTDQLLQRWNEPELEKRLWLQP